MQPKAATAWLAAIVSSANDAILSVTCDGVVTSFNPAAERLFGYREEEIVGQPISILVPADRQEECRIVTQIVAGERLEPYETIRLRKNGSLVNVFVSISPLRDAGGGILGAAEIARDISERKQTNDAALRSLGEGVYTIDQQGLVTFMNPAAEELFGWSFAELRGKKMHDMTHHHYRDGRPFPSCECAGFQVLTNGRTLKNHEDVFIRKDGTFFDVIYTITPMCGFSGKINGLIVVFSDTTERKRAEDRLREISMELSRTLDTAATGLTHCGRDLRYLWANAAYAKWIGLPPEQIVGRPIVDIMGQAAFNVIRPHVEKVLQGERVEFETELAIEGSLKPIHVVYTPDRNPAGAIVGWVASVTDISERKRHEEQINLLMHEVNHRSKNMLNIVQAVASQTAAANPSDFMARFTERLQALAASQDLLVKSAWRGVDLAELVRSQLAHFGDLIGQRIELQGPPVSISASAAQTIGMALHELATNSGKYGALSNACGAVKIAWDLERIDGEEAAFVMSWREQGGPPVRLPGRRGFGSTIIVETAEMSLDAKVNLDYGITGLRWELKCPAAEVLEGGETRPAAN